MTLDAESGLVAQLLKALQRHGAQRYDLERLPDNEAVLALIVAAARAWRHPRDVHIAQLAGEPLIVSDHALHRFQERAHLARITLRPNPREQLYELLSKAVPEPLAHTQEFERLVRNFARPAEYWGHPNRRRMRFVTVRERERNLRTLVTVEIKHYR